MAGSTAAGRILLHAKRQPAGFVFCLFFFFENWLYTATYMADARAQILPLVTTGDPDFVEHDFYAIFSEPGRTESGYENRDGRSWVGLGGMFCDGSLVGESNYDSPAKESGERSAQLLTELHPVPDKHIGLVRGLGIAVRRPHQLLSVRART